MITCTKQCKVITNKRLIIVLPQNYCIVIYEGGICVGGVSGRGQSRFGSRAGFWGTVF